MSKHKIFFITVFGSLIFVFNLNTVFAQAPLESTASLVDATIYNRGASLHHEANSVSIPKGNSELVINQIAQNVNPESIRVTNTSGQITILSVSFERDYLAKGENKSPAFLALKKQYEQENTTLETFTNNRLAEETALALLNENKKFGGQSGVSPISLAAMIKYYRDEYKTLATNIIELKAKEKQQQELVSKLKNQMQEAGKSESNAGQLVLKLNSTEAIKTNFNINYFTNNVSWSPFYEIQVNKLDQPLQLKYKAYVSQNTGIDWKQVKLVFSSGHPQQNNNAPELQTRWLRFYQPRPTSDYKTERMTSSYSTSSISPITAKDISKGMESTTVTDNQLTTSFVVNAPYDIYNNQKPIAVQLKDYQLPSEYSYFTAPGLDAGAFLVAKVTDWAKYNLLPGSANLIIDGNYAGTSYINPISTEDTLTLSLGRDERIITKRERINEEGSTSFLGASAKRVYTYEISVRNTRKEAITIDVKEQFPVSAEKDIEVKLLETTNAVINNEKGELSWNLNLEPGETKKIKISYSVKYPKGKVILGL